MLHDLGGIHDRHLITDLPDDKEVMGDIKEAGIEKLGMITEPKISLNER